jgi:hypothetical protein
VPILRHLGTRRQGELPELAEISSSDVVFWGGGPRAPPTHQPQPDPDAYRDLEAQRALSPSLLSNHAGSREATLRRVRIPTGPGAAACSCSTEAPDDNSEASDYSGEESEHVEWDFILPVIQAPQSLTPGLGGGGSEVISFPDLVGAMQHRADIETLQRYLGYYDMNSV